MSVESRRLGRGLVDDGSVLGVLLDRFGAVLGVLLRNVGFGPDHRFTVRCLETSEVLAVRGLQDFKPVASPGLSFRKVDDRRRACIGLERRDAVLSAPLGHVVLRPNHHFGVVGELDTILAASGVFDAKAVHLFHLLSGA